ncbi:MAG: tRNA pseudouridine(55) synthase TruB [Legionellales bacterium]
MNTTKSLSAIDGILLLNKSEGLSSNTALQKVKRLFGARKAGHTGSLDPLATGMLPICFGEATKICHYLLHADKAYETTGVLGIKTNTSDSTGEIISQTQDFFVSEPELMVVLEQYKGNSKQVPSMFSALKHQGTPLYKLARKGIEIERKARDIEISQLQLDRFEASQFALTVRCSKGTYIRNLVEDIGDALGVGAHVSRLHRIYTSGFEDMPMYGLDALEAMTQAQRLEVLLPMDRAVSYLRSVTLSKTEVLTIRQGRIISSALLPEDTECVRLYDDNLQLVGLGNLYTNGDIKPKRLLSFNASTAFEQTD